MVNRHREERPGAWHHIMNRGIARSPKGELSEAMKLTQNRYTRWFNRHRKRAGPL